MFIRSAVHRLTLDVCSQQSKTQHLLLPVRLRNMSHKWHSGDSIRNKFPPTASNHPTRIETHIIMLVCNSSLYFSLKEYNISGQSGIPLAFFFFLLEGMVTHNIERKRDFMHLRIEVRATGDTLASGDKLPSDHTSKADVRGQCDNSSTGNVWLLKLQW